MTGLSKAGVCKNASGQFYLSTSVSEFTCAFFSIFMFLFFFSSFFRPPYVLPVMEELLFELENNWPSNIYPQNRGSFCNLKGKKKSNFTPSFSVARRMRVQPKSCWSPVFFFLSPLRGVYFEWALSTKLINIIVQSHLFSLAELPGEIQTGSKETDGLLRISHVCLPLEQQACVGAGLCLMKGTH